MEEDEPPDSARTLNHDLRILTEAYCICFLSLIRQISGDAAADLWKKEYRVTFDTIYPRHRHDSHEKIFELVCGN